MKVGSLFSGAGGLDLAVEQVFGGEVVWHCENDPAAAKVLRSHWPDVPNLGDVTKVTWGIWKHHAIDALCAGWPCQPFSPAGKRKGITDERALWPQVARALRVLRPRVVVLENVPNVLRAGEFDRVAADLAALGYSFTWTCLRASDVGAPHRRERLFILATDTDSPRPQGTESATRCDLPSGCDSPDVALLPTPNAADGARGPDFARATRDGSGGDDLVTLAARAERGDGWGRYAPAIHRWEGLTRPAPGPTMPNSKGNAVLNPAFSEWMQGWPKGWVTEIVDPRDAHRIVGNGVCIQQAVAATRWLLSVSEVAA